MAKAKKTRITQQELKEVLKYDPENGEFIWVAKLSKYSPIKIGGKAGCLGAKGYIQISLGDRRYLSHRLVWLYTSGVFPEEQIDHIDGDRSNNRLENLREVPCSVNLRNQKMRPKNTSGITGVSLQRTKPNGTKVYENWIAQWKDSTGKLVFKSFAVLKYGFEKAKELAIECRIEQIQKLNALGFGYTERHGLPLTYMKDSSI